MAEYAVEVFFPGRSSDDLRAAVVRARSAAEELTREGSPVRYLRSVLLSEEETCFHVFDAESEHTVEETSRRAGIKPVRIIEAVLLDDGTEAP